MAFLAPMALSASAAYTLPYSHTPSKAAFETECVILDANGDGDVNDTYANGRWSFADTELSYKYTYHSRNAANDWLILPAVDFAGTTTVKVSYKIQAQGSNEQYEVFLGSEPTVAGMTVKVYGEGPFSTSSGWADRSAEITVPDGGTWHLGFHATTPANEYWFYIKDITIEAVGGSVTPGAAVPAAPTLASSSISDLSYTALVNIPSVDTEGKAIDGTLILNTYLDGEKVKTDTGLTPGSVAYVALELTAGEHTVAFTATLGEQESAKVEDAVTATRPVITPAAPVIKNAVTTGLNFAATVTMPALDTDGNTITDELTLKMEVDGAVAVTKNYCRSGADVDIAHKLTAGVHTVAFYAVLDGQESARAETTAEAADVVHTLPRTFTPSPATADDYILIDANGDGIDSRDNGRWKIDGENLLYTYHSSNSADDWAILPFIAAEGGQKLNVSMDVTTAGYPESFEVFFGRERTIAAMTVSVGGQTNYNNGNNKTALSYEITLPENGDKWALGIHATSDADKNKLYISNISISVVKADAAASAAPTLKASALDGTAYTSVVTMPAVDVNGKAIEDPMTLIVAVDGTETQRFADCRAGSDVDVALTLAGGSHTVSYTTDLNGFISEAAEDIVTVAVSVTALPFEFEFTADNYALCAVVDANGDKAAEDPYNYNNGIWSHYAYENAVKYTYHNHNRADDWVILPPVDFADATKVKISFDVRTESTDTEDLEVFLGNEQTPEAMTLPVKQLKDYKHANSYETHEVEVTVPSEAPTRAAGGDAATKWHLGFHATSPAFHNVLYVRNVRISKLTSHIGTGIESITVSSEATRYYNLQGMPVDNPAPGSMVIVSRGGKTYKSIVR